MAFKNIGRFLNRFKNLKIPKKFIQKEGARIIKEILNIEIGPENFEERNGILYIKTQNQFLKNEIFLKKEKILEKLKENLGDKSPKDIRF